MSFKKTIILAIVFAIGLAGVLLMNKREAKVEEQKRSEGKLLNIKKEDVKEIILQPSGIHAVKDSNEWKIVEPVKAEGDKSSINAIANMFTWAKIERVVSSDSSKYSEFGLKPEKGKMIIIHDAGSDTIYLGDKTPTNSYVFARKNSSPDVFLTTTSLQTYIEKKLFDLRDRRVLTFEKNQVNEIALKNKHGKFVLNKEAGKWNLTAPASYKADKSKVNQIITKLTNSRVKEFVDETPTNLRKYGLAKPIYKLDLFLGTNRAKKTLIIGKKHNGKFYAKDEARNPVFDIDSLFVRALNVSLADLRSKKIADFKTSDVDSFVLNFADSTIICKKDTSNNWVLVQPDSGKLKSWKISSIVSTIANLNVEEFVNDAPKSLKPYGLATPAVSAKFYHGDKLLIDLLVGKKKDDKVFIKTAENKSVYLAKKLILEKLKPKLNDILDEQAKQQSKTRLQK